MQKLKKRYEPKKIGLVIGTYNKGGFTTAMYNDILAATHIMNGKYFKTPGHRYHLIKEECNILSTKRYQHREFNQASPTHEFGTDK